MAPSAAPFEDDLSDNEQFIMSTLSASARSVPHHHDSHQPGSNDTLVTSGATVSHDSLQNAEHNDPSGEDPAETHSQTVLDAQYTDTFGYIEHIDLDHNPMINVQESATPNDLNSILNAVVDRWRAIEVARTIAYLDPARMPTGDGSHGHDIDRMLMTALCTKCWSCRFKQIQCCYEEVGVEHPCQSCKDSGMTCELIPRPSKVNDTQQASADAQLGAPAPKPNDNTRPNVAALNPSDNIASANAEADQAPQSADGERRSRRLRTAPVRFQDEAAPKKMKSTKKRGNVDQAPLPSSKRPKTYKGQSCEPCKKRRYKCTIQSGRESPPCMNCRMNNEKCFDTLDFAPPADATNGARQVLAAVNSGASTPMHQSSEDGQIQLGDEDDPTTTKQSVSNLVEIKTRFVHPILFDTRPEGEDEICTFCSKDNHAYIGIGKLRTVKVIDWNDKGSLVEIRPKAGYTKLCRDCTRQRARILQCTSHQIESIVESLGGTTDNAVLQEVTTAQSKGRVLGESAEVENTVDIAMPDSERVTSALNGTVWTAQPVNEPDEATVGASHLHTPLNNPTAAASTESSALADAGHSTVNHNPSGQPNWTLYGSEQPNTAAHVDTGSELIHDSNGAAANGSDVQLAANGVSKTLTNTADTINTIDLSDTAPDDRSIAAQADKSTTTHGVSGLATLPSGDEGDTAMQIPGEECSICREIAPFTCTTPHAAAAADDTSGCGLHLCKRCASKIVIDHHGNLQTFLMEHIEFIDGRRTWTRADAELLLKKGPLARHLQKGGQKLPFAPCAVSRSVRKVLMEHSTGSKDAGVEKA